MPFPPTEHDLVHNPVQELRIDHFLALEKGVKGAAVVKLAHEIIENYDSHSHKDLAWRDALDVSHKTGLRAEDKILDELQAAGGEKPSGARRNTFRFATAGGKLLRVVEAHENDSLVWDESFDGKNIISNARWPRSRLACSGPTGSRRDRHPCPPPARTPFERLPTSSPRTPPPLRSRTVRGREDEADAVGSWYELIQEKIKEPVSNLEAGNWARYHKLPAQVGAPTAWRSR